MNNTITVGPLHTARNIARSSDLPKNTVLRLLRAVLRVQMLQSGDEQQRELRKFFSSSDMIKITDDRCGYYGPMRHTFL